MARKSPLKLVAAAVAIAAIGGVIGAGSVYATQTFSDVGPSHPFYDQIEWGARNDITNGYNDGTFRPGNNVTRQAVMAWMSNYNDTFYMKHASSSFPLSTSTTQTVQCDPGDRSLAGGGSTGATDMMMTDSFPINAADEMASLPQTATGWYIRWESDDNAGKSGTRRAWVLCGPQLASL